MRGGVGSTVETGKPREGGYCLVLPCVPGRKEAALSEIAFCSSDCTFVPRHVCVCSVVGGIGAGLLRKHADGRRVRGVHGSRNF